VVRQLQIYFWSLLTILHLRACLKMITYCRTWLRSLGVQLICSTLQFSILRASLFISLTLWFQSFKILVSSVTCVIFESSKFHSKHSPLWYLSFHLCSSFNSLCHHPLHFLVLCFGWRCQCFQRQLSSSFMCYFRIESSVSQDLLLMFDVLILEFEMDVYHHRIGQTYQSGNCQDSFLLAFL